MMDVKLSVIIPIFNTENYLAECLDSILNQTYENWEAILVNDGSTDNSGNICANYQSKDKRFKTISKQNGGISSARNAGLEAATGEYVLFVDSDDIVEQHYFETMLSAIGDANAVACKHIRFHNSREIHWPTECDDFPLKEFCGNECIKSAYLSEEIRKYYYRPWGVMYNRLAIDKLRFNETLVVGEDIEFNLRFLARASVVKLLEYCGYGLRTHESSTTHTIEQKYSRLYEHDYHVIQNAIKKAQSDWNFGESYFLAHETSSAPSRYYHEVTNLFRKGTPYTKKQILEKISVINHDKVFLSRIRKNKWRELAKPGKLAFICAGVQSTFVTYILFYWILKLRHEI